MARQPKPVSRLIPGTFTKEERDAAYALQDAGIPHPTIDDTAWAKIEERWAALPRIWGQGPWVSRSEHLATARTTGLLAAVVYRVTTEVWGLEIRGAPVGDATHRGTLEALLDRAVAAWPPAPEGADQPTVADLRAAARRVPLPAFGRFRNGACWATWEGAQQDEPRTAAQERALRILVDRGEEILDQLLDGLFEDQRGFAEDETFPKARAPGDILKHVDLNGVLISRAERDGIAYTELELSDAWRVEHGLCAIVHGARVLGVGGYGDTRHLVSADAGAAPADADAAATRVPDGARIAARWVQQPHDAVVALPMWEGFRGRWKVSFVYEDEDDLELTGAQIDAARRFVDEGDAIRDALLAALFASYEKKTEAPRPITEAGGLKAILEPIRLRVHAEDLDGLAYTELSLVAPWRKTGKVTVVMHGARVVALTTRAGVEDAITDDQEARLRAVRAARAAKKGPGSRAPAKKARAKKRPAKR